MKITDIILLGAKKGLGALRAASSNPLFLKCKTYRHTKFRMDKLYVTMVFVIVGIMRYLRMIYVDKKGVFPTNILLTGVRLQIVF